jgi:allantoicase
MLKAGQGPTVVGFDLVESFTELADLAAERVGGRAIVANDEFFAPKENLLKPGRGVFIPDKFTSRGKWMDGWETRRRRTPGHDWCILRLGMPGTIRGVDIDTNHFIGNYPEKASLEACHHPGQAERRALVSPKTEWTEILPLSALRGGAQNLFGVKSERVFTHVRLNIHPDGGVARLRVYGDVRVDVAARARARAVVDLASIRNGGLVLAASDMHFGSKDNVIMPGRSANTGDGWETKRRRGPGHDWLILRLGAPGLLERIEVDTNHFKGNYPESGSLEGCRAPAASLAELQTEGVGWRALLPRTKLRAHHRHFFRPTDKGPFTHVRFRIFPDGGVSRLRLHGRVVAL